MKSITLTTVDGTSVTFDGVNAATVIAQLLAGETVHASGKVGSEDHAEEVYIPFSSVQEAIISSMTAELPVDALCGATDGSGGDIH